MRTHWAAQRAVVSSLPTKAQCATPADDFEDGFGDKTAVAFAPIRIGPKGVGKFVIEDLVVVEDRINDFGGGHGEDAMHFHEGAFIPKAARIAIETIP